MISAVDHIGIAVRDLEASMELYRRIFAVTDFHREQVQDQGVDIASFLVGDVRIELTAPLHDQSPIAIFLDKRGEGIHHIAFRTDTIDDDLTRLNADGIRLINTTPQAGAHDMLIAFLHPKSTGGVLMELCSPNH
ncbi:MAG: methylmalonyl-CoA epimerase ['Candidatus Kapabacteria' thiocyanatum]|uniref:Methylmalonyl-CoA epimerase n=1 Tax=Candidatus Kapaibacterium thiocyanatum TaxID=1895771 RepID=A0A1M3KX04_9BACT|nr:methylmalonyl-CoA epimerase ['Candidatus Kapabacteria' thiocyanatum]OJX56976.1 MAG: methylmalonyl-CoA epimerase ['Candidatus Kapabacteria' thiocyanatum]